MNLDSITVDDFKSLFFRDFQYLPSDPSGLSPDQKLKYVWDQDITRAFSEARILFNQGLFGTDDQIKMAFLYLAAHYLVTDLKTAASGSGGGGGAGVLTGRTVGNVSESYEVPQAYKDNPAFALLSRTGYGLKYLSLVIPRLVGNVAAVCGATRA